MCPNGSCPNVLFGVDPVPGLASEGCAERAGDEHVGVREGPQSVGEMVALSVELDTVVLRVVVWCNAMLRVVNEETTDVTARMT